jgi:YfiH family protein
MKYRFTNRTGGVSTGAFASLNVGLHVGDAERDVLANRAVLEGEYGPIQYMNQVHGDRVAIIETVTDEYPTVDSLVTGIPGITLAVQVADCIPLLLHSTHAVAAVHVGRKGLVNAVTVKTLEIMRAMGAMDIKAIIGPSICGPCYEVSQEIYDEVTAIHPAAASQTARGTVSLDLPAALRTLLESEAITIVDESRCTVEDFNLYSYRRDGVTGRQVGIITL